MEIEKINQIFPYLMIAIFCAIVILVLFNKKHISKQVKKGKYYTLENKNIFLYLQYFLFFMFFDVAILMILLSEGIIIEVLVIMSIITILFIVLFYCSIRQTIKFKIDKEIIIKNGIKIEGIVKEEYVVERNSRHGRARLFYMIVEYLHNGEKKIYTTPQVEFGFSQLSSTQVDVYVYNDKVFVTDFKLK